MEPETFKVIENKEVEKAKDELFEKGGAYELLLNSTAWGYLKEFITTKIASFSTEAILNGFKDMDEMQFQRGIVVGLRSILVEVESTLESLNNAREENGSGKGVNKKSNS